MSSKHTPGPWQATNIDGPWTAGGDGGVIEAVTPDARYVRREICCFYLDTGDEGDPGDIEEDIANARLIAAAPDLLEACEDFLCRLDYLRDLWGDEGVSRELCDQVRAAIVKATGGRS